MQTERLQNRFMLRNRYVFRGRLVMRTALHIGGGRVTLSSSNSPVVLTPDQKPFIPGSSFKGALRSTVEKMVPNLPGFSTCSLIEFSEDALHEMRNEDRQKICSTVRQGDITQERRDHPRVQSWRGESQRKVTLFLVNISMATSSGIWDYRKNRAIPIMPKCASLACCRIQ